MNKQFIFKHDNIESWDAIRTKLENEIFHYSRRQSFLSLGEGVDFQVEIKPLNFRGKNALKAYWVLIGSIVKWDANNNGYKQEVWDEWFKKEAGLIEKIDLEPLWKMKYSKQLKKYNKKDFFYDPKDASYSYEADFDLKKYLKESQAAPNFALAFVKSEMINLGQRFYEITRSISNKGDVTKEEMERLINCVLKFGAENEVPNCEIRNDELDKLLEFYD